MSEYHYGVYIGRFQPLHVGHEHVIREALEHVDTLIIIIGSSHAARTPVNPFTFEERKAMINMSFSHEIATGRLVILPLYDYELDYDWAKNLRKGVEKAILDHANTTSVHLHGLNDFKVALAGFGKDASSYYLKMFPEWGSIQLGSQWGTINASDIRTEYFRTLPQLPRFWVSEKVTNWLHEFALTPEFKDLIDYRRALEKDRAIYGKGPFLAADSVIVHRGKVLLITRGKAVGRGCYAMPGGFVEEGETFYDAAVRETAEETGLAINDLGHFLTSTTNADNPKRSLRGRIVSVVHRFDIPDDLDLPKVAGGDDASHADWYDFDTLPREKFYEDHHSVLLKVLKG